MNELQVTMYWAHGYNDNFEKSYSTETFGWNTVRNGLYQRLEELYQAQGNSCSGEKLFDNQCTLSIGDIIEIDGVKFLVIPTGFLKIIESFEQWCNAPCHARSNLARELEQKKA